jgi:Rrf2 family iron-sulfur cluster assembly transcriptional regulator
MKLTTKGRYAVIAMVDIARSGAGRPVSLAEIAERQGISLAYLEQLFCKLRRGGLVASVRGPGGGYRLGREAGAIPIADIILAVDDRLCADDDAAAEEVGDCAIRALWRALADHVQSFLRAVSLADVVAGAAIECEGAQQARARRPVQADAAE